MKNSYDELREIQQERFNNLPIGFAYSEKQFNEMMHRWGLDPDTDTDQICYVFGRLGFARKSDLPLIKATVKKEQEETEQAIASDRDGTGFIYDMFVSEMFNHEYGLTHNIDEVLEALGLTADQVNSDERFQSAMKMASEYVIENTCC